MIRFVNELIRDELKLCYTNTTGELVNFHNKNCNAIYELEFNEFGEIDGATITKYKDGYMESKSFYWSDFYEHSNMDFDSLIKPIKKRISDPTGSDYDILCRTITELGMSKGISLADCIIKRTCTELTEDKIETNYHFTDMKNELDVVMYRQGFSTVHKQIYDYKGRLQSRYTNGIGTYYYYDEKGREKSLITSGGSSVITTLYEYDDIKKTKDEKITSGSGLNVISTTKTFYNENGEIDKEFYQSKFGQNGTIVYKYTGTTYIKRDVCSRAGSIVIKESIHFRRGNKLISYKILDRYLRDEMVDADYDEYNNINLLLYKNSSEDTKNLIELVKLNNLNHKIEALSINSNYNVIARNLKPTHRVYLIDYEK